jgi:hypothetical protein
MHYMDKPTPTQLEGVGIGRETGVAVGSDLTTTFQPRRQTATTTIDKAFADSAVHPEDEVQSVRPETGDLDDFCDACWVDPAQP